MQNPKPNRSDEILSCEEQVRMSEHARHYFELQIPAHPPKPCRSDIGEDGDDPTLGLCSTQIRIIPHHQKFMELQDRHEHLADDTAVERLSEEFAETEYYKELNQIDKTLHHTTGTGFINIEGNHTPAVILAHSGDVMTSNHGNPTTNDWIPAPPSSHQISSVKDSHNHGNPATNDWIPSPPSSHQISSVKDSHKPGRSET